MSKLPRVSGKKLITILEQIGFTVIRSKGSHHILKHTDGRVTVIPVHANEDLGIGILTKILKDANLSNDDFLKLL